MYMGVDNIWAGPGNSSSYLTFLYVILIINMSYLYLFNNYGAVTHSGLDQRTGSTYIAEYKKIVSGGKITRPLNWGD